MQAEVIPISPTLSESWTPSIVDVLDKVFVLDNDGVILDVNGYEAPTPLSHTLTSQYRGKPILTIAALQPEPYLKMKLEGLLAGKNFSGLHINGFLPQNGQQFWMRCFGVHCHSYCVVGFENITKHKLLEAESLAAIQKFQALFDNHPGAVFCFDSNGFILNVNKGGARISGYGLDELIGRNFARFFLRQDLAHIVACAQKVFRGEAATFEASFIRNDGNRIYLSVTFIPINGEKAYGDGYYGIARDITESKKLSLLIQELKEEYEDLFENAPLALFSGRKEQDNYVITRCNRRGESMFGYHRDELYQLPIHHLISPSEEGQLDSVLKNTPKWVSREVSGVHKCGNTFPTSLYMSVFGAEKEKIIVAVDDISIRRQLETTQEELIQKLKESHEALEHKSKLQALVLRVLGHDFRSPFSSILGGAKLLMDLGLSNEQRELVDIIYRGAHHELKLIDNLLQFTQIAEGNLRFSLEPLSCHVIVHEVRKAFLPQAQKKGVNLVIVEVASIQFLVDADMFLRHVIGNIVHNAIKYSYPGQNIYLDIKQHANGKGVVTIRDTGIGIPAEILPHVFDIHPAKNRAGTQKEKSTGFGLYIASQMIRLMGGEVQASSVPGEGTVITIMLPVVAEEILYLPNEKSQKGGRSFGDMPQENTEPK